MDGVSETRIRAVTMDLPDIPIDKGDDLARMALAYVPYAVIVIDENRTILLANPAAELYLAGPAGGWVGKRFPFALPRNEREQGRVLQAEDGSWTAELHTAQVHWRGRDVEVVCLWDTVERQRLAEVLRHTAMIDELTGALNARGFSVLTQQQLRVANRSDKGLLVFLIGVDDIQAINDAHGRRVGDQALVDTVRIIRETFRDSDIVARVRGAEFAVAALEAHPDSAGILTARLRDGFWDLNARATRDYQLSVSAGLARYDPRQPCATEVLLERARAGLQEYRQARGRTTRSRPVA